MSRKGWLHFMYPSRSKQETIIRNWGLLKFAFNVMVKRKSVRLICVVEQLLNSKKEETERSHAQEDVLFFVIIGMIRGFLYRMVLILLTLRLCILDFAHMMSFGLRSEGVLLITLNFKSHI